MSKSLQRSQLHVIKSRLEEEQPLLQVLVGPRQVGKTTLALQLQAVWGEHAIYATADESRLGESAWIDTQWARARQRVAGSGRTLLLLDEVQKIDRWSETVKRLHDEDVRTDTNLRVVLLGSAALLIEKGLTESLAGRFERTWMGHWSWQEMREAFGYSFQEYIQFGGYPGAAVLRSDPLRWQNYLRDSIVEAAINRDVLQMTRIDKPALLRAVFYLACAYSSRELSYQKMLGQLQDAGNTTTLSHYLQLLHTAGLVRGLQKYASQNVRRRGSSPKLLALDPGLITATQGWAGTVAESEPARWGMLVESAIGAHLSDAQARTGIELFYWRQGAREVDFVVRDGRRLLAIEVKSGRPRKSFGGLNAFCKEFSTARPLLVGTGGVDLQEFLGSDIESWF